MLPFCGYHMGDYFAHWLKVGKAAQAGKLPKIFYVNWFRLDDKGRFLWPGYGENSRVLKWVFERCDGTANAVDTPIGRLPRPSDLDTKGLDIAAADLNTLLIVDLEGWRAEVPTIKDHFAKFGSHLPEGMKQELADLEKRLQAAK
jgi:phosphoenolpyruvate carboxykinase (GTP)